MAIPQSRYINITSYNMDAGVVTDRKLDGAVFTVGRGFIKQDAQGNPISWALDNMIVVYSAAQALEYFSSTSPEYYAAVRYFNYLSPSSTAPKSLTYFKISVSETAVSKAQLISKQTTAPIYAWYDNQGNEYTGVGDPPVDELDNWYKLLKNPGVYEWSTSAGAVISSPVFESPKDALSRIDDMTNGFGSFCFIDNDLFTVGQMQDVLNLNAGVGFNYKYLVSLSCSRRGTSTVTAETYMYLVSAMDFSAFLQTTAKDGIRGCSIIDGCDDYSATIPMAIFSATNYNGVNTATFFMFKQMPGEKATVKDTYSADSHDNANVNYYGLVQLNGSTRSFFQRGVNFDGEDTAVYCNEIWLKSAVATEIMTLFLTLEKIPYDASGRTIIYNTICSVANRGITNGVITKMKPLTDAQKTQIFKLTNDGNAWFSVQETGYYLTVELEKHSTESGAVKYCAVYKLIYSKGDSISYVEGQHILV